MPKKHAVLENCRAEYKRSRQKKPPLNRAITYCKAHRIPEPSWLRDAQYKLGRALVMGVKKTGRQMDLIQDNVLFWTVEECLARGWSLTEACKFTARDYFGDPAGRERWLTVRSAWDRHRKRVVKMKTEDDDRGGMNWRIKDKVLKEYFGYEKNRQLAAENLPPAYLRRKNK